MATRVITYTPTEPTDFSDGNAMFHGAIQNMNQAFKTGIDTADTFGLNVRDRNQAVLDSIINGISQEDLAKPDTQLMLSNVIRDMEHNSAGMIDLGKAFGAIDKRGGTLVARNNAQLVNQENQIKAQTMQDTASAKRLVAMDNILSNMKADDPSRETLTAEFNSEFSKSSPMVKTLFGEQAETKQIADIDRGTLRNTSNFNFTQSVAKPLENQIATIAEHEVQANDIIGNPNSTPEQVAQAKEILANVSAQRTGLFKHGVSYDTYIGAVNKAKGNATQQKQKDREHSLNERKVGIQDKIANATIKNNEDKTAIEASKVMLGGSGGSGGSNDNPNKPVNASEEKAYASGYTPSVISTKGINAPALRTKFFSNLNAFASNENALKNNVSYKAYKESKDAKDIWKNPIAKEGGSWGLGTKGDDFLKALDEHSMPDRYKIAIHEIFATNKFPSFSKWFSVGSSDSLAGILDVTYNNLKQGEASQKNVAKAKAVEELNILTQASNLSDIDLVTAMAGYNAKTGKMSNPLSQAELDILPDAVVSAYKQLQTKGASKKK